MIIEPSRGDSMSEQIMDGDTFDPRLSEAIEAFADEVRAARLAKGLSQEDAAHRAGVSVYTYASIERGHGSFGRTPNPTLETVLRIMWALDMNTPR